jgi:hypothetical protein
MEKPPCADVIGVNSCLRKMHDWEIYGNGPLFGEWSGWRIAGSNLVAPDKTKISMNRVIAIMFQDAARRKKKSGNIVPFGRRTTRCTTA